jgi:hypothetical protein
MKHTQELPIASWEDVSALPEFSGNEVLAKGCFVSGHPVASIQNTLRVVGNPARTVAKTTALSEEHSADYAAALASIARRAAIMALPHAKGREALADQLGTDGATVESASATLAKAAADDGWRRAVEQINGKKAAAVLPLRPDPHGWRKVTNTINTRNRRHG